MDFDSDQESITPHQQSYIRINSTGALWLPAGSNAQRPAHNAGLIRYNNESNGVEFSNGSSWTTLGSGGGSAAAANDVVGVTWFIDSGLARILFNKTASTVNFTDEVFTVNSMPGAVTGQTVYIHTDGGYEGIYVLGSTAAKTAVPVTRHADWPASRTLHAGTKIYALYAAPNDTLPVDSLDPAFVSASTEKIGLPSYGLVPDGSLVGFELKSGATMPGGLSAAPAVYFTTGYTYNDGFGGSNTFQVSATPGGSVVNITSTGTSGGVGYIAEMVFHAPYYGNMGAEITLSADPVAALSAWTWAGLVDASSINIAYRAYSAPGAPDWRSITSGLSLGQYALGGSVAIGDSSVDAGVGSMSVAVGPSARAYTYDSVALGGGATATGYSGNAIGRNANASAVNALAAGTWASVRPGAGCGTAVGSNSVAYNPGSFAMGIRYDTADHMSTMLERIVFRTTDDTEVAFPPLHLGDEFDYVVTGKLLAASTGSTCSAVWEIEGTLRGSATNDTRSADLLFKRIGGDASSASAALKVRYVIEVAPTFGTDGMSQLALYLTGHPTEAIVWTGHMILNGVFNSSYSSVSAYAVPKTWNVGASVRAEASTTLTAGQFVNVYSASGTAKVRPADADAGYEATGFVLENYVNTNTAVVYLSGENPFLSSLTVGPLYLSTTAGAVTGTVYSSSGTLVQPLGTAISSTKMLVQIGVPVLL